MNIFDIDPPDKHDKYDCKIYGDPNLKKPCGLSKIINDDMEFRDIDRNAHDRIQDLIDCGKFNIDTYPRPEEVDYQMQLSMNMLQFKLFCPDSCIECIRNEILIDNFSEFADTLTMPIYKFIGIN